MTISRAMLNTGTAGSGSWAASSVFCPASSPSPTLHVPVPVELPRLSRGSPCSTSGPAVPPEEDAPLLSPTMAAWKYDTTERGEIQETGWRGGVDDGGRAELHTIELRGGYNRQLRWHLLSLSVPQNLAGVLFTFQEFFDRFQKIMVVAESTRSPRHRKTPLVALEKAYRMIEVPYATQTVLLRRATPLRRYRLWRTHRSIYWYQLSHLFRADADRASRQRCASESSCRWRPFGTVGA